MIIPDLINGSFEAGGSILLWRNVYQLYLDKQVKGVLGTTTAFFAAWGLWNLFYYYHLSQFMSWYGGMSLVTANVVWVGQFIYYYRKNKCNLN